MVRTSINFPVIRPGKRKTRFFWKVKMTREKNEEREKKKNLDWSQTVVPRVATKGEDLFIPARRMLTAPPKAPNFFDLFREKSKWYGANLFSSSANS